MPVPRPALSAARGLDIIDLLAAAPARSLSLSEVVRATGINLASCHAILTVLTERGYVVRDAQTKAYSLGPMVFAAGKAARAAQPLLAQAEVAARRLCAQTGIPATLSAVVGDEIVGILAIGPAEGSRPLLRAGDRRPVVPPLGAPFVAWSGETAVEAWLARAPEADRPALRGVIETIRDRGFEVLLRSSETLRLASQLLTLPASDLPAQPREASNFYRLGPDMVLPATIDPDEFYQVTMIAAPIFDRHGACAFNLCLGPFPEAQCGAAILDTADRLLRACLEVMHADRAR